MAPSSKSRLATAERPRVAGRLAQLSADTLVVPGVSVANLREHLGVQVLRRQQLHAHQLKRASASHADHLQEQQGASGGHVSSALQACSSSAAAGPSSATQGGETLDAAVARASALLHRSTHPTISSVSAALAHHSAPPLQVMLFHLPPCSHPATLLSHDCGRQPADKTGVEQSSHASLVSRASHLHLICSGRGGRPGRCSGQRAPRAAAHAPRRQQAQVVVGALVLTGFQTLSIPLIQHGNPRLKTPSQLRPANTLKY